MTAKVKGLLKGLRYISQIFDTDYKEKEMEIGFPTDVKHVAHIGWDGPSLNSPNWMNDFRSAPLSTTFTEATSPATVASTDLNSPIRELPELPLPRPRTHRHPSSGSPNPDSPKRDPSSGVPKHSRRHQSAGAVPIDSATCEPSDMPKQSRRNHSSTGSGGIGSPLQDLPLIPKQSRRRKTKGSSGGGGSLRSSRSNAPPSFSDPLSDERTTVQSSGEGGEGL